MLIKFKLTDQMVMEIVKVLRTGSYDTVAPILAELQKQINENQPKPKQ